MLEQTKEQIQQLVNKVQLLDFVLNSLNYNHPDYKEDVENLIKRTSNHKMKLLGEILRMSDVKELETKVELSS